MDDDRPPADRDAQDRPASDRLGDLLHDAETPPAAGTPVPPRPAALRPPAFRGDAAFRDDRFDDARDRETYGVSLADEIASETDDRPLADPWTRLGAQMLDGLAALAILVPTLVLAAVGGLIGGEDTAGVLAIVGAVIGLIAFAVYQLRLLAAEGQTIGKRALKLRIVDVDDGSNPGFGRSFGMRGVLPGVVGAIPGIGPFFSLVNVLFIFRTDRRCIHDHIAKTVVVTEAGR